MRSHALCPLCPCSGIGGAIDLATLTHSVRRRVLRFLQLDMDREALQELVGQPAVERLWALAATQSTWHIESGLASPPVQVNGCTRSRPWSGCHPWDREVAAFPRGSCFQTNPHRRWHSAPPHLCAPVHAGLAAVVPVPPRRLPLHRERRADGR